MCPWYLHRVMHKGQFWFYLGSIDLHMVVYSELGNVSFSLN